MKTNEPTQLYAQPACREQQSLKEKFLSFFTKILTIIPFTGWGKSTNTGNSGAAGLLLGHSTFGSTGRLYPLYKVQPATLTIYRNRQAYKTAANNACTVISLMSYTFKK